MAGTGKSQVIRALITFFNSRNEGYRFICMAPTGSAASLISGSTYHSMLGFSKYGDANLGTLRNVRDQLKNVDYMFIDEISMVDCNHLYDISACLHHIFHNDGEPFGGKNMIFAADFTQLEPPGSGFSLFSAKVSSLRHSASSWRQQGASLGNAIWHQVTTVVILQQNMRQISQTTEDAKFRKLLENLHYKACTMADVNFLRGRIAGCGKGKPKLNDPNFRNVSMILSYNSHRDRINELGVTRFAKDTGQMLETFYSLDHYGSPEDGTRHNKSKKNAEVKHKVDKIHPHLQEQLWMLPHKDTNNHPGKLSLCIGLPVMIKANEATECNVTNGAEAIVVGWESKPLTGDKRMLEVVFVKLTAAPTPVKLDGLPENVVPIAAQSMKIPCLNGCLVSNVSAALLSFPQYKPETKYTRHHALS